MVGEKYATNPKNKAYSRHLPRQPIVLSNVEHESR